MTTATQITERLEQPERFWQNERFRRVAPLLLVYGILILLFIYTSISSDRFPSQRHIFNNLRQAAFLGTVAVGQTFVILTAGIDLSVGALVKVSVLVAAIIMDGDSANIPAAVAITMSVGLLVGVIHATLITRLNIAPFIVTLGTFSILRGVALMISDEPIGRASPEFLRFYDASIPLFELNDGEMIALPVLGVGFFILVLASIFVLRRTIFGRYIYAIGGNEEVARLSGIPVTRVKYGVYIICSLLASLTGLLLLSRSGVGDPVAGDGLELQAITAVILGGTSLFGGRGGMVGTLGGVLLLGFTSTMLVVLNALQWIRQLIQGVIIVLAVALYRQKSTQ
jgi:ribose/xylose/arabinose/galactoside ABC-type transport system permease subunit